ncbi:hypothetical protein Pelo_6465 [Pelomyxa schiedti]|nr:hypothetical protein Pelo_6465 [Pelomyxa schiedti]
MPLPEPNALSGAKEVASASVQGAQNVWGSITNASKNILAATEETLHADNNNSAADKERTEGVEAVATLGYSVANIAQASFTTRLLKKLVTQKVSPTPKSKGSS